MIPPRDSPKSSGPNIASSMEINRRIANGRYRLDKQLKIGRRRIVTNSKSVRAAIIHNAGDNAPNHTWRASTKGNAVLLINTKASAERICVNQLANE